MIPYKQALDLLRNSARRRQLADEKVLLDSALGRISAETVCSSEDLPAFSNSAMDGYAVRSEQTREASSLRPLVLRVSSMIAAGDASAREFGRASLAESPDAVEIMTGAPIPEGGYDAVVRLEDTTLKNDSSKSAYEIELRRYVPSRENVREAGSDFRSGQKMFDPGVCLGAEHIAACASLGIGHLRVKRNPRVAIISTGNELHEGGMRELPHGKIRNSSGPYLQAVLRKLGVEAERFSPIPDRPADFRAVLQESVSRGFDVILSTGAVSVGKYDFVDSVLRELSIQPLFHKVAIRPGKPLLFAEMPGSSAAFFGLPGNPVSTAVGFRFFVLPYLRGILGLPPEVPARAQLDQDAKKPEGLKCFFKAKSWGSRDGLKAKCLERQASYVIGEMLNANAWAVLPEDGTRAFEGSEVELYPLDGEWGKGFWS